MLQRRGTYLARPEGNEGAEGVARLRLELAHLRESSPTETATEKVPARLVWIFILRLSRRGSGEPDRAFVLGRRVFSGQVHVVVLEDLVDTIFKEPLERVADEIRAEICTDLHTLAALLSRIEFKLTLSMASAYNAESARYHL